MSSESLTQPLEDQRSPSDDSENVKRFCYVIVNDIWNEINAGDTIVGRDASLCSIVISDNTLSKVHAIIESEGAEDTFIYDVGSTNGTKMGRMVLKPHCRYKLNDNDTIVLGSTSIQFKIVNHKVNSNNNLSPLNTGGKSQSFENHTYFCNEPSTSNKNTPAKLSLSTPVRHQKKFYYKTDSDSSLVDIFNQPTQCTKKNVDQDLSDDEIDIYNLTTQCDFLEKSACSKISQTSQSDKAEEDIKCSINNSGTFSFVNNSKSKKCIISDECKSVDDIFDLATQCQLNEDVEAISDSSNAKKKVSEDLKTLNCVDTSHKLADNSENGHCNRNPDLVKCSESLLCDGEDDALCEVMKTYSQQSVTNYSDIPLKTLISQSEKISSDEIFDTPTQVCVDGNGTEFKEGVSSYKAHNKSKDSEGPVKDRNEAGAFQSTSNNLEKDTDNYIDEDLVLTQDFNASFKVPKAVSQKQCKTSVSESGSHIKGKKSDTDDVYRLLQEDADLEDLIATQIFKADNVSNKEKEDKSSQNNCSQDDVATQIFFRNITGGELENIVPEKTAGSPSRNGIPVNDTSGIVEVSDSGDETESDIEEKLCIESNKGQMASIVNKTTVKSGSSSTESEIKEKSSGRCRSSSESTDKTVSDLDVNEIEGNSVSVQEKCNSLFDDANEDFIATQVFPVSNNKGSRSDLPVTGCDTERLQSSKQNTQDALEDFIPTQVFPTSSKSNRPAINKESTKAACDELEIFCLDDIEDTSNESESLIKDIQQCDFEVPAKREIKTDTLQPIGNIGDSKEARDSNGIHVISDSDATDCEEEEVRNSVPGKYLGEITMNAPVVDLTCLEEETDEQQLSPRLIETRDEPVNPSTSEVDVVKNKSRILEDLTSELKKRCQTLSFMEDTDVKKDSPLKRAQLSNSDEPVPNKRLKNNSGKKESDGRKTGPDISEEIVLTQSRKLRNRIIRRRDGDDDRRKVKKGVRSPKSNRHRLTSEADLENMFTAGNKEKRTRQTSANNKDVEVKSRTVRKLQTELVSYPEEDRKRSLRTRKCDDSARKSRLKIVFTGFDSESHNKIIEKLGGEKVNDLREGDVLVTDKVRRTVKFLSAIARGVPVVSPKWLVMSGRESRFLNPWGFLLEDKPSEERWGFDLRNTIEKWRGAKLLSGYSVHATENTKPPVPEILSIVDCCGGTPLTRQPDVWPPKSIILSCVEDRHTWPSTKTRHVKIVHFEFLLSGVLRYMLDFKKYKLR